MGRVTLTVSTLATYLLKHPLSNSAVDVRRAAFCHDDTHTMKIIQAVLCAGKMVELLRGEKKSTFGSLVLPLTEC